MNKYFVIIFTVCSMFVFSLTEVNGFNEECELLDYQIFYNALADAGQGDLFDPENLCHEWVYLNKPHQVIYIGAFGQDSNVGFSIYLNVRKNTYCSCTSSSRCWIFHQGRCSEMTAEIQDFAYGYNVLFEKFGLVTFIKNRNNFICFKN